MPQDRPCQDKNLAFANFDRRQLNLADEELAGDSRPSVPRDTATKLIAEPQGAPLVDDPLGCPTERICGACRPDNEIEATVRRPPAIEPRATSEVQSSGIGGGVRGVGYPRLSPTGGG
jgi:hypothetical protein